MKRALFLIFVVITVCYNSFSQSDSGYIRVPLQFTFITPFGTNGLNSFKTINEFSFNIIAGLHGGLDGFEMGSVFNGVTGRAKGVQLSGVSNLAWGGLQGAQIASVMNLANKNSEGFQMAGNLNIASGAYKGVQLSGMVNTAFKNSEAVQIGGVTNIVAADNKGAQIAGVGNFALNTEGLQLAGVGNVADEVDGAQIAGVFNLARNVDGLQLGLFNACDSIDGVAIGLVSFVRKGYRAIEVSGGDALHANISYKMGVNHLYNIYSFGAHFQNGFSWAFGLGMGSRFLLNNRDIFSVEIVNYNVKRELFDFDYNSLTQVKFNIARRYDNDMIFKIGPVWNTFSAPIYQNPEDNYKIAPYSFYNRNNKTGTRNTKMWVGLQLGIEF